MCMLDEIRAERDEIYAIARKHKAGKLWVFGSCARKEERPDSDVDFLVKFGGSIGFFELFDFESEMSNDAKKKGISNCPYCAIGHSANAKRIYTRKEMEADHVTAWTKGGATTPANCQMLCITHNRAKGNR